MSMPSPRPEPYPYATALGQPPVPGRRGSVAALGWLMAAFGLVAVISSYLPWAHVTVTGAGGEPGRVCTLQGMTRHLCDDHLLNASRGVLTVWPAIGAVIMGVLWGVLRGQARTSGIAGIVLGLIIAIASFTGTTSPGTLPDGSSHFNPTYGLWLTLASGVLLMVVGIRGAARPR